MRWGDLESEEEEEEVEEESDSEAESEGVAPSIDGLSSVASGYGSSVPSGIETPEVHPPFIRWLKVRLSLLFGLKSLVALSPAALTYCQGPEICAMLT